MMIGTLRFGALGIDPGTLFHTVCRDWSRIAAIPDNYLFRGMHTALRRLLCVQPWANRQPLIRSP
jgi:hypothetical protein